MQLAIVSDIHANLQAWNAVLLDARSINVDGFICLGDIVGYGPNPAEVLSSVHANVEHLVLGNHDAVACGKMSPDLFNDSAAELIHWTKTRLNNKAVNFLSSLPLSIECEHFRCSHGDISDPAAFNYICEPEDAVASWVSSDGGLFLVGHTHEPAIFILGDSGVPRTVEPQDFLVEEGRRYIVNPGSVGQPRDGHALASYIIYDSGTKSVYWRRVPFDLDQYMKTVTAEGLDASVNYFMNFDPRAGACEAREYADFSPARYEKDKVSETVEIQQFDLLTKRARKWKKSFAVLLTALLLLLSAAGTMGFLHATRRMKVPAESELNGHGPIKASLRLNTYPSIPLSDFNVIIGNKRQQTLSVQKENKTYLLNASSESDAPIQLLSPPIPVKPDSRLTLEAMIRKGENFQGSVCTYISLVRNSDGKTQFTPRFLVKEPNMPRKGGFLLAKKTFDVPADTTAVSLGLLLNFRGDIEIAQLELYSRD